MPSVTLCPWTVHEFIRFVYTGLQNSKKPPGKEPPLHGQAGGGGHLYGRVFMRADVSVFCSVSSHSLMSFRRRNSVHFKGGEFCAMGNSANSIFLTRVVDTIFLITVLPSCRQWKARHYEFAPFLFSLWEADWNGSFRPFWYKIWCHILSEVTINLYLFRACLSSYRNV